MNKEKLQALLIEEDNLLTKINTCSSILGERGQAELAHLCFQIINKLIYIHKDLVKTPDSQILIFSSLRYIFETLVNVKLLKKELNYVFKLYYRIHNEQINKTEILIERLSREIILITEYERLSNEEYSKLGDLNKLTNSEFQLAENNLNQRLEILYKKASLEFTIFFENVEFNGFSFQKEIMNKNLSKLKDHLEELKAIRLKKAEELFNDQRIRDSFDTVNAQNFFDLIKKDSNKKDRSWRDKACLVDLEAEYKQIYDFSSHLVHSLPYSLITSFEIDTFESKFTSSLILNYSRSIIEQIEIMLDIEKIFPFDAIINLDNV